MTNRIEHMFTQASATPNLKGQQKSLNRKEKIYGPKLFGLKSNAEAYGSEEIYFLNVSPELVRDRFFTRDISNLFTRRNTVYLDCGVIGTNESDRYNLTALRNGFLSGLDLRRNSPFHTALEIMPNGDFNFGEHERASDFKGRIWVASNQKVDMTTNAYVERSQLDGLNHLYIKLACGQAPDRVAPQYKNIGENFLANSSIAEGGIADYPTIVFGDYYDMSELGADINHKIQEMPRGEKLELVNENGFNVQTGPTFTKLANGGIGVQLTEKNGLQERTIIDSNLPKIIYSIVDNSPQYGSEKEVRITSASKFELDENVHEKLSASRMTNGDIKIALYESGNNAELQEILVELAREVLQTGKQVHIKLFKERIDGNHRLWDVQGARSSIARKIATWINEITPITDGRSVETRASNNSLIVRIKPKKVVDKAQIQRDENVISKLIYTWVESSFDLTDDFENILNRHEALTIYNKESQNGHIAVEKRLGEIIFTIPNSAGALEENVLLAVTDLANNLTNDNAITLYGGDNGETITLTKVNNSIQISMTDITSPIQNKRFFKLVEKFLKSNSSIDFNTNGLDVASDEFSSFSYELGMHLESAFGRKLDYTHNSNIITIKRVNRTKAEWNIHDISEVTGNALNTNVYKHGHVELKIGEYKLDIKKGCKADIFQVELDALTPEHRDTVGAVVNELINFGIKVHIISPDRNEVVKLHKKSKSDAIIIEFNSNGQINTLKYITPFFLLQGKTIELVTSKNDVDTEKRVDTVLDITMSLTQPLAEEGKTVQITPIQNATGSDLHYRLRAITAQK